ncbi:CdiA C-terminal domain-containing protein [Metabacillus niabensis]|uniref:tRNA nuclease CdiA C-terminal domain-containing protein n=1 Tax=Metabacillus niabensis TaxID=324854 RepID=A0ABT9Z539_9BACI|nr:hypothetical protein [Metabacillus niabensis]MDQ0227327.1 hypothetical protein [Metabacillus niabensis]
MKRDLKINYGILDGIIEQLHTYKNALDTMHSSLETLVSFIRNNYADSIDAWDDVVKDSKKHIKDYQGQIGDLLSLFEGYVDDTTAYITPLARNSMMRVDRNDIWANLCQVESGVTNNVPKAINITYNTPFSFAFWEDPTDEEKERSRANKEKLEYIRGEIKASKSILEGKVDALWNLYDNKIVPFENTDDAYNNKAADVKDKYTDFFEGVVDVLSGIGNAVSSFVEGLVDGIIDIVVGLVTIIVEAGIVAVSNQIPDFVEPDILKDKANEIKDKYSEMVVNAVEDPFSILESLGQGVTDTAEEEGIMYIAGNVSTSFIPYVGVLGKAKWLKAVDNGNGPKTKPVSDGIQAKVKDLVNNNKAFEGIKNGAIEFVSGVRNGAIIFFNGVFRTNNIEDRLATVGVPSDMKVPWNVLDNKTIQDDIVAPLKMLFSKENDGGKVNKDTVQGGTNLTEPSLPSGGKPKGNYGEGDSHGIKKQNETADLLADAGYDIEMLDEIDGGNGYGKQDGSNPDFLIEGNVFDCYSPKPDGKVQSIIKEIAGKTKKQTGRIVLCLDNFPDEKVAEVTETILRKATPNGDLKRLEELILVKDGKITRVFGG